MSSYRRALERLGFSAALKGETADSGEQGAGRGGNIGLAAVVDQNGMDYCRQHFRFTLLEHRPISTADAMVLRRETHWKNILFTRRELNHN